MPNPSVTIVSNLYPNCHESTRGLFIKQLSESLAEKTQVTVVAPLPVNPKDWLNPSSAVPAYETINGISVYHPRYIVIPKMLRSLTGWLFYRGVRKLLKQLAEDGKADVISAHWVYPDGFGAVLAAKELGRPVAVHALGCDINEYTRFRLRRKMITSALTDSNVNIVKSQELKDKITALGVPADKTLAILNGVDQKKFFRLSATEAREKLGLDVNKNYLLFIGNFQIEKGLNYLLDAAAIIKDEEFELLVIGGGPLQSQIEQQLEELNIKEKVKLVGRVEHHLIPQYLQAANLLCLPSLREGCPNVVLESLSCGTPVIASRVGAVPDILSEPEFGVIVEPESASSLAEGIRTGLQFDKKTMPDFKWYSWQENADRVMQALKNL